MLTIKGKVDSSVLKTEPIVLSKFLFDYHLYDDSTHDTSYQKYCNFCLPVKPENRGFEKIIHDFSKVFLCKSLFGSL